ncbi:MAG: hypothetical protein PHI84_22270 [Kiritimatiellae bacterium]|nr:hypothetical protein [Kiritimatiellia bacterium]
MRPITVGLKAISNNTSGFYVRDSGGTEHLVWDTDGRFGAGGVFADNGTSFYVDGNAGVDTNDGLSWATAVKTVAAGIALADDDIAVTNHWDRRNRLFVNGGAYKESLVRFPEKTDIIGVGNTDFLPKAKLIGVQVPAAAVMGCRFINMAFQNVTAANTVDIMASCHGISFINCDFIGNGTTTCALEINDCVDVLVQGCHFYGLSTSSLKQKIGIQVKGTATNSNLRILDNIIVAAQGIIIDDTDVVDGIIAGNILDVTTLAIDENADRLIVANNQWISAANCASSYDLATTRVVNNTATGADKTMNVPVIATS